MKIVLNDPALPDEAERYVKHLGILVNGKGIDFSAEEVKAFEEASGLKIEKAFANDDRIKLAKGGGN